MRQRLEQHAEPKGADAQLKAKEKEAQRQRRRERHKSILNNKDGDDTKDDHKDGGDHIGDPPEPPFHERMEQDAPKQVIVPRKPVLDGPMTKDERKKRLHQFRHFREKLDTAKKAYGEEWDKYTRNEKKYRNIYDREWKTVIDRWKEFNAGRLEEEKWMECMVEFTMRWRPYHYWKESVELTKDNEKGDDSGAAALRNMDQMFLAMYLIAINEFDQEDADLWVKWKKSKQQSALNQKTRLDRFEVMRCLNVNNKVEEIYKEQHPEFADAISASPITITGIGTKIDNVISSDSTNVICTAGGQSMGCDESTKTSSIYGFIWK